jgi:hypothetical protein
LMNNAQPWRRSSKARVSINIGVLFVKG